MKSLATWDYVFTKREKMALEVGIGVSQLEFSKKKSFSNVEIHEK